MTLNDALRKVVDEAIEELDQPESRYLLERVCSDTIGAVVTAIRSGIDDGSLRLADDVCNLVERLHSEWKKA